MQTLDHPPLLDFYRNSTDEDGHVAHRPSMLELLHGNSDKNKEFDEFEVCLIWYEQLDLIYRNKTSALSIIK
jgi:hypothetical protein